MDQQAQQTLSDFTRSLPPPIDPGAFGGLVQGTAAYGSTLTPRELQVVALVSCGYSNKHIARCIFISENTVKYHLKNAYGKLRVNCRAQAAMAARGIAGPFPASAPCGADPQRQ